ncbi:hypothetical protein [Oricola sp.]|uniref:hypothetical protein n=1 Tax=Oricola sp. TaxID=1979950 RepID=UPI003BAAE7F8
MELGRFGHILLAALLAMAVSACGRAGEPELPPASATEAPADQQQDEVEDKPFVLDALI